MSVFKVGSNKSSQNNFPSVRPTLDLDFANSKTLDPRITFTRASGGSYVGADGLIKLAGVNEPRFDHDPVTGESLGFLVEEARTNISIYSETPTDASWAPSNCSVTANAFLAPNGTVTAGKLVENTATAEHILITPNASGSGAFTASVYLRAAERTEAQFLMSDFDTGGVFININLSTGTSTTSANGGWTSTSSSATAAGNGWYRVSVTGTRSGSGTIRAQIIPKLSGSTTYTGNGTSGIYLWGFQLEAGSFPTSYIPTEGSSRTRAADSATITGTNFSSWYNQSSGSVVVNVLASQGTRPPVAAASVLGITPSVGFLNGNLIYQNTDSNGAWYTADSGILELVLTIYLNPNGNKFAWGLTAGASSVGVKDGATRGSYSWSSIVRTGFLIGTENIGYIRWKRITYYPKRLTDAQLQVLTR